MQYDWDERTREKVKDPKVALKCNKFLSKLEHGAVFVLCKCCSRNMGLYEISRLDDDGDYFCIRCSVWAKCVEEGLDSLARFAVGSTRKEAGYGR